MDSMEIREKLRKDPKCKEYVIFYLACFFVSFNPFSYTPKKRHLKKAEKFLEEYLNYSWLIENKVKKYVRGN